MSPPSLPSIRVASAPGKLVVAGEYSVLEGATAWVTAVGRRATATLSLDDEHLALPQDRAIFQLTSPGRARCEATLHDDTLTLDGDDAEFFRLAGEVLRRVHRDRALPRRASFTLDSSTMSTTTGHDGQAIKLGLGSSAAISAAMVCALLPHRAPQEWFALAFDAHDAFSGGAGSGIDVAAACLGGDLLFTRNAQDGHDRAPTVTPFAPVQSAWTKVPVFVGHAQNTREFLAHVATLARTEAITFAACMRALTHSASTLVAAATREGDDATVANAVFSSVDACRQAMDALGAAANIDIVSAPHRAVAEIAVNVGGAAKPSGAGGGDVAWCFVPSSNVEALRRQLVDGGFMPLALDLATEGARIEAESSGTTFGARVATDSDR